ncbi:MAG: TRAP transporter small permease [Rubrivivax sp.]|nr:TRAP transporter small permease [Rubrivivax sp.]
MRTVLAWLDTLAALALLGMMALVVADVAGRYVIGRPLPGAIELVQYAMVLVVFTGLPVVTHRRKHISLGMLDRWLGNSARVWHQRLLDLSSAVVLAVMAWILFNAAGVARDQGDVIGYLNLPVYPAAYFMVLMSAVTAMLCLVLTLAPPPEPTGGAAH